MTLRQDRARPLAVVTGGSHGVGYELARRLAADGYDLVVSCAGRQLHEAAVDLADLGADVRISRLDLADDTETEHLVATLRRLGRPVAVMAVTTCRPPEPGPPDDGPAAGHGPAADGLAAELRALRLDVVSMVHLTRRVVADMVAQRGGRVLLVVPPPTGTAVHAATTAFIARFAAALDAEHGHGTTGVTVTALVPLPDAPCAATAERGYAALAAEPTPAAP